MAGAVLIADMGATLAQIQDLLATRWGAKKVRRIPKRKRKARDA